MSAEKKRKLESVKPKRKRFDCKSGLGKKHTVDKRVEDRHGAVGNTRVRVNLLQNCKKKNALDGYSR